MKTGSFFYEKGGTMKLFIGCSSVDFMEKEKYRHLLNPLLDIDKLEVILGGATSGLMQLVYQMCKEKKVPITFVVHQTYQEETENYVHQQVLAASTTMDRSKYCYQKSDFCLFLNGGIGTFCEFFSFLEEKRTAKDENYPIYIYNEDHSFDVLYQLLEDMEQRKVASRKDLFELCEFIDSQEELIEKIKNLNGSDMK